jgi:hypothetical protein
MAAWGIPVGDRLRVMKALEPVRTTFAQRRADHLCEGLWRLANAGDPLAAPVLGRIAPEHLLDQGLGHPPNLGGLREGDTAMADVTGHGRVPAVVPAREELERADFQVPVDLAALGSGSGYISPQDLALALAAVRGLVEVGTATRLLLEDGLQLLLAGDAPPALLAEVIADARAEVAAALGQPLEPHPVRRRAYDRRWAQEAAAAAELPPDPDDEPALEAQAGRSAGEAEGALPRDVARARAEERLLAAFDAVAAGRVTADGNRLEAVVYRDKVLLALLGRLGIRFLPGRVPVLAERDVLRREFLDGIFSLP